MRRLVACSKAYAELEQLGLAARGSGEAHAEGRRFRVEAFGKRDHRGVRHHPERHDHRGVAGLRGDRGPARAREQQCIQVIRFDGLIDSVRAA